MKSLLLIFALFLSFLLQAQNVIEKKVIYSTPGIDNKLTNGYGVTNLEGGDWNNSFSNTVEVIDLYDKGFILRDKLKLVLFDNAIKKVAEVDLKDFYIKNLGIIKFYHTKEGLYLIQNLTYSQASMYSASTYYQPNFKVAFLRFDGKFEVKNFDLEKSGSFYSYFLPEKQELTVVKSEKKEKTEYKFSSPGLNYKEEKTAIEKNKDKEDEERESKEPGPKYLSLTNYKDSLDNFYIGRLSVFDDNGNGYFEVLGDKDGLVDVVKKIHLKLPFLINATQGLPKLWVKEIYLKEEIRFAINETTKDGYLVINCMNYSQFKGIAIIKFNLLSDEIKINVLTKEDIAAKINVDPKKMLELSLSNILGERDAWFYQTKDHFILNFHGQAKVSPENDKFHPRSRGLYLGHAKKGLQITLDKTGEILKVDQSIYGINYTKHNNLVLLPKTREEVFKAPGYKPDELSYILSLTGLDPKQNLFAILKRDGYSYILNFKSKDSEVEITKLKF